MAVDRSVPVLVVKIGRYPVNHGGLGAIRTLGRLGVPVYAITEDRFTPAAMSRYTDRRFVWPTTGQEDPQRLVDGLLAIAGRLDRAAIALPTDDEAAVLVAEHSRELGGMLITPRIRPDLPRTLADKSGLHGLCRVHGCPTPFTALPSSVDELLRTADEIGYPVVIKNAKPWDRLQRPAVTGTTIVQSASEMRSRASEWPAMASVLVQEYLPHDGAEDWIVNVYCDASSACLVRFTGVKVRCWPPGAGVATRCYAAPNPVLAELTADFCGKVGYRGIGDLDWRLDRGRGQYQLLDFNPRVGAQFRLFESEAGIDVVRALHLDLTGRPVPEGRQDYRRGLRVENLDLPAFMEYRRGGIPEVTIPPGMTELAWLAADDPLPALSAAVRSAAPAAALLARRARTARAWGARRRRARAGRSATGNRRRRERN